MTKYQQTKFSIKDHNDQWAQHGNCFQTVIGCMLDVNPINVPNVEVFFDEQGHFWWQLMKRWLLNRGVEIERDDRFLVWHGKYETHDSFEAMKEQTRDRYYMAIGPSKRGVHHVCIFQNGSMVHDPHPSNEGLNEVERCEVLVPITPTKGEEGGKG